MKQLSPEALEVLRRICRVYAARPFEEGKEERLRPAALCRAEQKLAMHELRRAGFLVARQKIWGEKLYQIPAEQLPTLEQYFFPYRPIPAEETRVSLVIEAGNGLAADLFKALLYTAKEGLPLTGKGSIHKKNIIRLAAQLSLREEYVRGLSIRFLHSEIYPTPAAIAVDLMLRLGLISKQGAAYTLESGALESWLRLPEARMTDILYSIVMSRYGSPEPACQHFRHLIDAPAFLPGEWVELSEVLDWMILSRLAVEGVRAQLEESGMSWLNCLADFGWCELGITSEGGNCFRWIAEKPQLLNAEDVLTSPDSERISNGFIVQPDFEILVPPEVPYSIRWTLAGCAELLHSDTMWSFRLSREMLESASEQGMSPEDTIAWLHTHALGGLPPAVEMSLEQWGRNIGRTQFSEVMLLVCKTEEDGAAIAAHPRLQGLLDRIGPLHFSIQADGMEQVRKELTAAGMAPARTCRGLRDEAIVASPVFLLTEVHSAEYYVPDPLPERGLFNMDDILPHLPFVTLEPETELLPGEEAVPSMWSREWRHYHSTTAQKVMRQALDWGIKVRLSLKEQICEFIPSKINVKPWRVTGQLLYPETEEIEEVELTAGEWKEMQLIIPIILRNSSSA